MFNGIHKVIVCVAIFISGFGVGLFANDISSSIELKEARSLVMVTSAEVLMKNLQMHSMLNEDYLTMMLRVDGFIDGQKELTLNDIDNTVNKINEFKELFKDDTQEWDTYLNIFLEQGDIILGQAGR